MMVIAADLPYGLYLNVGLEGLTLTVTLALADEVPCIRVYCPTAQRPVAYTARTELMQSTMLRLRRSMLNDEGHILLGALVSQRAF